VVAHLAAGREPPTKSPDGLSFREFTDLRRGESNGSRLSETARMHPGELLCVPLRGWELLRAWNAYRKS
jgi:hypothetical protein